MTGGERIGTVRPRPARTLTRALALASLGLALAATAAGATPTQVDLRVEGGTQTLFEGPIATEGHEIEASSDTKPRQCDGVNPNDPENVAPGATPTAAAVDAMTLIGETFDGHWYEGYDDYLITRWGPVREAEAHSWFVLVNHVLADVGGCQVELQGGSEVVWAYALASPAPKAMLELYAAGNSSPVPPLTADAKLGTPFAVEVQSAAVTSGKPPLLPERTGFTPATAAEVAPVNTGTKGFETIETESPATVLTNSEGKASVAFTTSGWHRLKATRSGAVASNRLDVCVSSTGEAECGPTPPEDLVRSISPETTTGEHEPKTTTGEHEPEHAPTNTETHTTSEEAHAAGVQSGSGPAVGSNLVSPVGAPGMLRVAGYSLEALDVRARTLRFHGHWRRIADAAAWHGVAAVGSAGATLTARLGAGRPAFVALYSRDARVEVHAGRWRRTFVLPATHLQSLLSGPRRTHAGAVGLRVVSGKVAIDGVAVIP